jgi:tetratricopeptide (TPR) repeat protein
MAAPEHVLLVHDIPLHHLYGMKDKTRPLSVRIGLRGWLRERMQPTMAMFESGPPTIGLYFRHGNGEFLCGRFDPVTFPDHAKRMEVLRFNYVCEAAQLADSLGLKEPRYFIASDNADFISTMKGLLPNSFSLSRNLPDKDYKSHLLEHSKSRDILFEAVQDIWALSSCTALILSESLFARFAALNSDRLTSADVIDINAPRLANTISAAPVEQALAQAKAAYEEQPEEVAHLLAETLRRAGDETGAAVVERRVEWFNAGMKLNPEVKQARFEDEQGRRDDAISRLRRLVAAGDPNPYVIDLFAEWLYERGDVDEAEAVLRRAVELDDGIRSVNDLLQRVLACKRDTGERSRAEPAPARRT